MSTRLLACGLLGLAWLGSVPAMAAPQATEAEALHVLNRLGNGPAPGDIAHVMDIGVDRYIDEQLHPERLPLPPALTRRLAELSTLGYSQADLVSQFRQAGQAAKSGGEPGQTQRRQLYQPNPAEAREAPPNTAPAEKQPCPSRSPRVRAAAPSSALSSPLPSGSSSRKRFSALPVTGRCAAAQPPARGHAQ